MIDRARHYWNALRTSLWFVPLLMSLAAAGLAAALLTAGTRLPASGLAWLVYSGTAENARNLLAALLTGMLTITSLAISATMIVLTLAAAQLGPRLIRNFIRQWQTQTVIGLFMATILYLLVVFRTLDGPPGGQIPHFAVSGGTALTIVSLFALLFFVHTLARSIVADRVIMDVADELAAVIERLLPDRPLDDDDEPPPAGDVGWISLPRSGYVQTIDFAELAQAAATAQAVIRLDLRPGHYVLAGGRHVAVLPAAAGGEPLARAVRTAFIVGDERTPTQDLEFGIMQLVEIALRALSSGINDSFTAVAVIDALSSALARMFERPPEPTVYRAEDGSRRVWRKVSDDRGLVEAAFDQIRQSGSNTPAILIRLLEAFAHLAPFTRTEAQRRALLDQAAGVLAAGERKFEVAQDLAALRERYAQTRERLLAAGPEIAKEPAQ